MSETTRSTEPAESSTATMAQEERQPDWSQWEGPDGELGKAILEKNRARLASYMAEPTDVREHANHELDLSRGGYADRQIVELTQNSADQSLSHGNGSIEVVLTADRLYFADDGIPIDEAGVTALLHTHLSDKRGNEQIGRFGLGFKSLLRVSDNIDFISRSCSFRFDRARSSKEIGRIISNGVVDSAPMMRLAYPFDPKSTIKSDSILKRLATNHTNIIRVDLSSDQAFRLSRQMVNYPSQFLLLIDHIEKITLINQTRDESSTLTVHKLGRSLLLDRDGQKTSWRRFRSEHQLTPDAIADRRTTDESGSVELTWAVPEQLRGERGKFWAFFPTQMDSLVAGILNAPWKTNEDRTNLLPGDFNDELIDAMAKLIAWNIGDLRSGTDPARHLDALPPREQRDYTDQAKSLRRGIFRRLNQSPIVPDRQGELRQPSDIHYPPRALVPTTSMPALDVYTRSPHAPRNSLHISSTTPARWIRVEELNDPQGLREQDRGQGAPHPTVSEWLEALTRGKSGVDAVEASRDAIQVAALLDDFVRPDPNMLGRIFQTQSNDWRMLDQVFLPSPGGTRYGDAEKLIHDALVEDDATLAALKTLGVKELSKTERFRDALASYLRRNPNPYTADSDDCEELWLAIPDTDWEDDVDVVKEVQGYRSRFPVRVASGTWKPLKDVIWPGRVCGVDDVPDVCVDTEFHSDDDMEILDSLGVWDGPRRHADISCEPGYARYVGRDGELHKRYRDDIDARVHHRLLEIKNGNGLLDINDCADVGPLAVLSSLPDSAKIKYTESLLRFDVLFVKWTVSHADWGKYESKTYDSYPLHFVRKHGIVSDGQGGVVRLSDAGEHPGALRELVELPTWSKIKEAFGFDEPSLSPDDCEPIDAEEEELIIDVWPGLREFDANKDISHTLVRCSGVAVRGVRDESRLHYVDGDRVFVVWQDDKSGLMSVNAALGLGLSASQITEVLQYEDRRVEDEKRKIRACATDAERLLRAVGERNLLNELPTDFRAFNRYSGENLEGISVAEAAIANWQTDALWHCRGYLGHLAPPKQWAGGRRILEFVESLGFGPAWARERSLALPPYEEVRGPFTLPDLHQYQQLIVDELRFMLRARWTGSVARRGLISLPTGAGKTRVAVQAVVEAMRDDDFSGDVLWVADREELCEQAIDSWQEVWRCVGPERRDLRISRLYAGRDAPIRIDRTHVVVASIQTLNARLGRSDTSDYDTVRNVGLVVLDEAHHAIAPTYTRLMDNLGFQQRDSRRGPVMLGLTATPYRGRNEEETDRLAARFYRNRLDRKALEDIVEDDPESVIRYLQSPEMQVLAKARHRIIDGGELELTAEERRQAEDLPWLPRTAEERLATNAERTDLILKAYEETVARRTERWPTLVFATSVRHAQTIAAVLCRRGIPARWVSSDTQTQTRRRYVEEYRDGKIDVLVNYGVFREGFDAPKTRVVIVARPVYSPNLYFQMIGRGLRGPANGGNNECLIIDVRDNILEYKRQLAFTELEGFWD